MTTDIQPSLGHAPLFTQAGQPLGYDAIDLRRAQSPGLQEGAYAAGSHKVTQRSGGANLSVDVAADTHELGVGALVQGDTVSGQGLYPIPPHTAAINEAIATADSTNPRIDQVILEVLDDTHDASANNKSRVRVLTGTATSGATLDNRTGATALPDSAVRLADVLVAASDTAISDSEIRDRRTWARGAYRRIERTSAPLVGSNTADEYRTTSTSTVTIDATNLKPRIECSGVPLRVKLIGTVGYTDATAAEVAFALLVDGAESGRFSQHSGSLGSAFRVPALEWELVPAAGSHIIEPAWTTTAGTVRFLASADKHARLTIEETVRQNTSNG